MNTNVTRLSIGMLAVLVSLPIAWIVTAGRAAETASRPKQSERATAGELSQRLKARYDIAVSLLEAEEKRLNLGKSTVTNVHEAARRVRDSAVELISQPAEQLAALTYYLAVTRRLESSVNDAVANGTMSPSDGDLARYFRLDAEIALLRVKLHGGRARQDAEAQ